jgi:hypothetical protein
VKNQFYIKLNWLFLGAGVVLPKLHYYFINLPLCQCSLPATVNMLGRNKKEIWGCLCQRVINMFSGLGKKSGEC